MQCSGGDGVYGKSGDWNHVVGKFCSPGGGTGPCCRTRGPQTLSRSCPGAKGAGEGMIILKQTKFYYMHKGFDFGFVRRMFHF